MKKHSCINKLFLQFLGKIKFCPMCGWRIPAPIPGLHNYVHVCICGQFGITKDYSSFDINIMCRDRSWLNFRCNKKEKRTFKIFYDHKNMPIFGPIHYCSLRDFIDLHIEEAKKQL